jgi:AmmeMemoRadiSam system protein B
MRLPAVAGHFYPADPVALTRLVDRLLDAIEVPPGEPLAQGYVVPHAGYRFSGLIAAEVYARLRRHADEILRVVLVGPAHRVPLKGCAVPATGLWRTPLGDLPIDPVARVLAAHGRAVTDDTPHAPEHSLEVQLPFLQRAVGDHLPVLPIVVGASTVDDVADTIAAAVGAESAGTVVLCSTDLSHFLPDNEARAVDERTAQAVLALAADRIGVRDACGVFALRGLIGWARRAGLAPQLLRLSTSADTSGDLSRVVGYPAFALHHGGEAAQR